MLRTRPPLSLQLASYPEISFDLHVLSTPPAFVLSQDQTLRRNFDWLDRCSKQLPKLTCRGVVRLPGPARQVNRHAAHNLALSSHPALCSLSLCLRRDQHCKRAFLRGDEKADRTFVAIDLLVVSHVPLRAAGGTIARLGRASTGFRTFLRGFFAPPNRLSPELVRGPPNRCEQPPARSADPFVSIKLRADGIHHHGAGYPVRFPRPGRPPARAGPCRTLTRTGEVGISRWHGFARGGNEGGTFRKGAGIASPSQHHEAGQVSTVPRGRPLLPQPLPDPPLHVIPFLFVADRVCPLQGGFGKLAFD